MPIPFWLRQGVSALDEYLVSKQAGRERGMQEALNAFDAALRFSQAQESQQRAAESRTRVAGLEQAQQFEAELQGPRVRGAEALASGRELEIEQARELHPLSVDLLGFQTQDAKLRFQQAQDAYSRDVANNVPEAQAKARFHDAVAQAAQAEANKQRALAETTSISEQPTGERRTPIQEEVISGAQLTGAQAETAQIVADREGELRRLMQARDIPSLQADAMLADIEQKIQQMEVAGEIAYDADGNIIKFPEAGLTADVANGLLDSYFNRVHQRQLADLRAITDKEIAAWNIASRQRMADMELKVQNAKNEQDRLEALADLEDETRKEINGHQQTKVFREVKNAFNSIQGLRSAPDSALKDIALMFNYMKMLDPGSVVREGEQQLFRRATSIMDRTVGQWWRDAVENGESLNDERRKILYDLVETQYQRQLGEQTRMEEDYTGVIRRRGGNVQNVILPSTTEEPPRSYSVTDLKSEYPGYTGFIESKSEGGNTSEAIRNAIIRAEAAKALKSGASNNVGQ